MQIGKFYALVVSKSFQESAILDMFEHGNLQENNFKCMKINMHMTLP